MRWKISTGLALAIVMLMTVPPVKVKAQALVEIAISLVVIVLGPGEIGEIYWVNTSQANPEKPTIQPGNPSRYYTIVFDLTDTDDTTCHETIQVQVKAHPGLNTLTLAKNGASLRINGEETFLSKACLINNAIRVAYQVGMLPPGLNNSSSLDPSALASQSPQIGVISYAITDLSGTTHAVTIVNNHLKSKGSSVEPVDSQE